MKELDDLVAEVAAIEAVDNSAIAFINGVPGLIAAAIAADHAVMGPQLQALTDSLTAKATAIGAAIAAQTPAAPQP